MGSSGRERQRDSRPQRQASPPCGGPAPIWNDSQGSRQVHWSAWPRRRGDGARSDCQGRESLGKATRRLAVNDPRSKDQNNPECRSAGPSENAAGTGQSDLAEARSGRREVTAVFQPGAITAVPELLNLARQYASECAGCSGRGFTVGDDGISGRGPDDVEPTRYACEDCADIREVIAKAEGRL